MNHFCRQASRLSSDAFERPLRLIERIKLNTHLLMCRSCRYYAQNLRLLHQTLQSMGRNADAKLPIERKQAIIADCHADAQASEVKLDTPSSRENKA